MTTQVSTGLRQRREAVVREHLDAENRHDVPAVVATFARPKYDVIPMGEISDGAEAVHDLLKGLFDGFPDFHAEFAALHHADDAVIGEVDWTGTHNGAWAGIPATGRPIAMRGAVIFEFDGEGLTCEKVYFDMATILRQLGVLPEG